jgi:hypothetical protein
MDGRSGLNILYAETYDAMGLAWLRIQATGAPFHGVVPGMQAMPLGQVELPITFGSNVNFPPRCSPSSWPISWGRTMQS